MVSNMMKFQHIGKETKSDIFKNISFIRTNISEKQDKKSMIINFLFI